MTSDVNSLGDLIHVGEKHKQEIKRRITKKKKRKRSRGGKQTNRRGGCCKRKELSCVHGWAKNHVDVKLL